MANLNRVGYFLPGSALNDVDRKRHSAGVRDFWSRMTNLDAAQGRIATRLQHFFVKIANDESMLVNPPTRESTVITGPVARHRVGDCLTRLGNQPRSRRDHCPSCCCYH